ncbi:hypothetical protein FGIG_04414 [Fasciola gigantica]|uniref:Uncharacterized protein n=1 Tax=Fasciola gigantica TaxID=46835 RepID=A0A504YSK5_FASGI|nr:hypothetical protein FGIG_04414 [Fasciola gigantica]
MEVHLFMCRNWKPTVTDDSAWPCNTEEMHPRWFPVGQMHPDNDRQSGLDLSAIPFKHMWPDDRIWLHRVLNNDRILGWVHCAPLSSTDPVQSGLIGDSMEETNGLTIDPFEIPAYQLQCIPPESEKKFAPERRRKFIQSVIDQLGLASDERLRQWMRSGAILDSWKSELLVFG